MSFKRTVEDFVCEHCHNFVTGSGYTNHCPKCLWSKHVDVDPGDRAASCGGMMEPIRVEGSTPKYRLIQKCQKCGIVRHITVSDRDEPAALLALVQKQVS
jgi:hypothetical protein